MKRFLSLLFFCSTLSVFAQTGTDIILFDISISPKQINLTNPANITNHKGYDNQPFFYKTNIYYSSQADSSQMDIIKYDYVSKTTTQITHTADNEFSPTVTPDGKYISCILQRKNGKQDLIKYPINAAEQVIIIDNLKVGYHTWADNNTLLLFILEDTATFTLHYYNTKTKEDKRLATNIGRGINKIPGQQAVSFIKKDSAQWLLNKYDLTTKKISTLMTSLPNRDLLTWTKNGAIIMSDGKDIYFAKPGTTWQKIKISGDMEFKNITRLAINEQNNKLAIVVAE